VLDSSAPAFIEMFEVAVKPYFKNPDSVPTLTNHDEVQYVIRSFKISKSPGPNGIPNRV
jgi:hypothetical protein